MGSRDIITNAPAPLPTTALGFGPATRKRRHDRPDNDLGIVGAGLLEGALQRRAQAGSDARRQGVA
jgi:hypothetical protein